MQSRSRAGSAVRAAAFGRGPGPAGMLPEATVRLRQFKGGSLRASSLYSYRKKRLNLSFWPGLAHSDILYSDNLIFFKYWSMF